MDFLESPRFPLEIGRHSTGGPQFCTDIISLRSGHEQRNARWSYPRHRYDVASGIQTEKDLNTLRDFFYSVKGRWMGFRFKDWADFTSSACNEPITVLDQVIGIGDGVKKDFQLQKNYTSGTATLSRRIVKPVANTVVIAVNHENISEDHWQIDFDTGVVTFTKAPVENDLITAGFEFDVPCRFDTDQLMVQWATMNFGGVSVSVVECS